MSPLRGLIVGVANDHSIAWGIAQALRAQGAELALTYLNAKAEPHVTPLAKAVEASLFLPLDVSHYGELESVVSKLKEHWGRIDFFLHSIAFAPREDLHGRLTDCSSAGFAEAMDISCHSLIRMTKALEPLLSPGGAILTVTYLGAEAAIQNYNLMGPVKAALEASVRYLAMELGPQGIRVNAISPGPVPTRAASGLQDFSNLVEKSLADSPLHQPITIDAVGEAGAFLLSPAARLITGQVLHVDGGYSSVR